SHFRPISAHLSNLFITIPIFHFFFTDTANTHIYTLSLHDALPICSLPECMFMCSARPSRACRPPCWKRRQSEFLSLRPPPLPARDRKSTRLNSSHVANSYAVFCLKKKKKGAHRSRPVANLPVD